MTSSALTTNATRNALLYPAMAPFCVATSMPINALPNVCPVARKKVPTPCPVVRSLTSLSPNRMYDMAEPNRPDNPSPIRTVALTYPPSVALNCQRTNSPAVRTADPTARIVRVPPPERPP